MAAKNTPLSEQTVKLNDEMVSQYLQDNPHFFVHNDKLAQSLIVPHPVRGAISLLEWKMLKQSEKITQLEGEITSLMEHASANQMLIEKLILLQSELLKAKSLADLSDCLDKWAKSLGLMGASFYLFDEKWQLNEDLGHRAYALNAEKFDVLRVKYLQYSKQYLGKLNSAELDYVLPNQQHVGSVALSLLGERGELGVTVFFSRDPLHYQRGQGTLMLEKITEILPLFIRQWVSQKAEQV